MNGRHLLAILGVLIACSLPLQAQDTETPPPVELSGITGNLHQLQCNQNVGIIASVGEDGILLVDTGYRSTASEAREQLAHLDDGPVRIVINTHGDGDHVGGNGVLGESAVIIAHPYVRTQMVSYYSLPPVDAAGVPQVTLNDEATIYFNGDAVQLIPVPGGHTAGDLVVHFTKQKTACIGDLVLVDRFPNADPGRGGNILRLIEVLKYLEETLPSDTVLVAAHGGTISMQDLAEYIEMIEGIVAAVASEIEAGSNLDEIVELNPLAPWSAWERPEAGLTFENVTREIYAGLTGEDPRLESVCAPVTAELADNGFTAAIERYRELKREEPKSWNFAQRELNMLGYQLLARDMVDEAIAIFKLNVEVYPDEYDTYDSLGEGYMAAGEMERSIANYERSLKLNPDNTNAVAMLARIQEERK